MRGVNWKVLEHDFFYGLPVIPRTSSKYELTRAPGNVEFRVWEEAFKREHRVGMQEVGGRILYTWTPKVCKIMAFMAVIMGLGL